MGSALSPLAELEEPSCPAAVGEVPASLTELRIRAYWMKRAPHALLVYLDSVVNALPRAGIYMTPGGGKLVLRAADVRRVERHLTTTGVRFGPKDAIYYGNLRTKHLLFAAEFADTFECGLRGAGRHKDQLVPKWVVDFEVL